MQITNEIVSILGESAVTGLLPDQAAKVKTFLDAWKEVREAEYRRAERKIAAGLRQVESELKSVREEMANQMSNPQDRAEISLLRDAIAERDRRIRAMENENADLGNRLDDAMRQLRDHRCSAENQAAISERRPLPWVEVKRDGKMFYFSKESWNSAREFARNGLKISAVKAIRDQENGFKYPLKELMYVYNTYLSGWDPKKEQLRL